jgi:hypothetical protein
VSLSRASAAGTFATLMLAACGLLPPPVAPNRDLEPVPDGLVLEPARGATAGVDWAFGVYRWDENVCFYTVADGLIQGPGCGPMPGVGSFGPFDSGGDLAGGWTYVGGIAAPRVVTVRLILRTGAQIDVSATPIDDVGLDAAAFFVPLEPGVEAVRLVALDAQAVELDHFDVVVPDLQGPPVDPTPSG